MSSRANGRNAWALAVSLASAQCVPLDRDPPEDAVFSEGCGGTDYPSLGLELRSVTVEGATRSYWVRVPGSYDPEFPFPLILMFHGAGGTGPGLYGYDGIVSQAGARAMLVYPEALVRDAGGTQWAAFQGSEDVVFTERIIDELAQGYCIDEARIFVAGHSSGGYMANQVGCELSPRIRALGSVAGGPPLGTCGAPAGAWLAHGTEDDVVTVEQGLESRDRWLLENGCSTESEEWNPGPCVRYDCPRHSPVVWCEHDTSAAFAHNWPDFAGDGLWKFLSSI